MKHDYFENLMQSWRDGELAPSQSEELRAHCASCPRCAKDMERWRAAKEILFSAGAPAVLPNDFADRVMTKVYATQRKRESSIWVIFKEMLVTHPLPKIAVAGALSAMIISPFFVRPVCETKGAACGTSQTCLAETRTKEASACVREVLENYNALDDNAVPESDEAYFTLTEDI